MGYYIFAFILMCATAIFAVAGIDKNKDYSSLIFILGTICGGAILLGINSDRPTALDVYQGKTTLRITYKNEVAIDSIVVFKDKK